MKKIKMLLSGLTILLLLSGCSFERIAKPLKEIVLNETEAETTEFEKLIEYSDYVVCLNLNPELIETFIEAPNWNIPEAEEQYFSNKIPDWVIADYTEFSHDGRYDLNYYINDKLIIRISGTDIEKNQFNLFKKDGNLHHEVFDSTLRRLLYEDYDTSGNLLDRSEQYIYVDLINIENAVFAGIFKNCSLFYFEDNTLDPIRCARYSKVEDLEIYFPQYILTLIFEFDSVNPNTYGYISEEKELIFPVLLMNGNSANLNLLAIAKEPSGLSIDNASYVTANSTPYCFYGDAYYWIENASEYIDLTLSDTPTINKSEFIDIHSRIAYTTEAFTTTFRIAVVNDTEIKIGKSNTISLSISN